MGKLANYLDACMPLLQSAGHVEMVIEKPLAVYTGAARGQKGKAGNQAATGYGMGRLAGALESWWWATARREAFLVTPAEWRKFYRISGDRAACKASAIALCKAVGWGAHLAGQYNVDAVGDVAEAVLMAMATARNPNLLERE
jgi:hypothetical protein